MTKSSVNSVYADLTKLLGDINKFLEEQVKDGTLKPDAVLKAIKLIDRSKHQIERIDSVAPQNDDYVIMHNNVPPNETENDNEEDHYALVVEPKHDMIRKNVPDVSELPASEILQHQDVKSGQLTYYRKTDMWFFRREQYLKVFGAVFEGCLLIYKSEKSKKPVFSLNLITYRGQELINSKRRGSFEVTDKIKSYNFIARNEKDMEQWLSKINKLDNEEESLPAKKLRQQRPIPEVPKLPRRNSETSVAYIDPDGDSNYATPGEDQAGYYVVSTEKKIEKNNHGDYSAYSSVQDEENDDDEKIYAIVVPPSVVQPTRSSFLHRQTSRR